MSEKRKLAAILVADVVGYSRLTGADEEGTIARLRTLRSELLDPTIAARSGRVVKRMGDGIVVEFQSVVEAVRCALDVVRGLEGHNLGQPDSRRIDMRIGVHLGDVVEEAEGDLMGDGVNIAARLQAICKPRAIYLSEDAYRQVRDRINEPFVDLGEQTLKNIARPIRVFAIESTGEPPVGESAPLQAMTGPPRLSLPDKPSIAVLPFQNMSGDPDQDYFADGMVEDIVTGLSRIKWLFVIARNSSFVYKGRAVDVRQAGRELGVRYLVEGGVRKSGSRLRVTAQLVEAETGSHLWAQKFDGELEDIFDFQDQITERVVGIVEPSVRRSEIERSRRKRPESLDAYDLYLRALPSMATISVEDAPLAANLLRAALKVEPSLAVAHAYLSWCQQILFTHGALDESDKAAGLRHARAAIANDVDDATALAVGAMVIGLLGKNADAALNAIERALSFNPSSAAALYFGAQLYAWSGDPLRGTEYAHRALRLSPFDPLLYAAHLALGIAALQENRYDETAAWWGKVAEANPKFGMIVIGQAQALALAGRIEEAKAAFARGLELEPSASIRSVRELGYVPALEEKLIRGARILGLPE
jgi:adenylate cyclase